VQLLLQSQRREGATLSKTSLRIEIRCRLLIDKNGERRGGDACENKINEMRVSYGPPWAHYLVGYQDRLLGGPLGLPGLRYTAPDGVEHKDYGGEVLG
jgi:hypothetical protein